MVLTESSPKFIEGHLDGKHLMFISASHIGRQWGLTLRTDRQKRAGWEKVDIVENGGSHGLVFVTRIDEEVLEFDGKDNAGGPIWKGGWHVSGPRDIRSCFGLWKAEELIACFLSSCEDCTGDSLN